MAGSFFGENNISTDYLLVSLKNPDCCKFLRYTLLVKHNSII